MADENEVLPSASARAALEAAAVHESMAALARGTLTSRVGSTGPERAASSRPSAAAAPAKAVAAHAANAQDHGHDDHHGIGHVMPKSLLLGVLAALIILTVMTVGVTMVDLGSQGNFIVAMAIATVKAALVMGFFMHLVWDARFNVVIFLSSFFFVILFLMVSLLDRQEYQPMIDEFARDQAKLAE